MKHGNQFEKERFEKAGESDELTRELLHDVWDIHNLCSCEDLHPSYREDKTLTEILDYNGIDYLVDTFDAPAFGINHRVHTATESKLRFDLRSSTGTKAPSELDKLRESLDAMNIQPKYATRLKQSTDGFEWFRVIELQPLIQAIEAGLQPHDVWTNEDETEAWLFDYDLLEKMNIIYAKQTQSGE
ncbi:hypothetical protein 7865G3C7_31 [Haloquadratum phage sp.]|nr:hypothetical protein 7865G3C7_31 [Haloquadratum phage sp.]